MDLEIISSKKLFESNNRFDLVYKILYLKNLDSSANKRKYYEKLYLESIKAFNNYQEDNKKCALDFVNSFVQNYRNIKTNGFDPKYAIPINRNYQIYDGAHRLSISYVLGLNVYVKNFEHSDVFDYNFFDSKKMTLKLKDIGALEYVKLNSCAHIVQIFPIVRSKYDSSIESILKKYGFIYYKKKILLNYNALINLKKINYGSESWAGNSTNNYSGLRFHANNCIGYGYLRVFIFVCKSLQDAKSAKSEIRKMLGLGNFPIHINDEHSEAVNLANIYFNSNALDWCRSTSYKSYTNYFQNQNIIKNYCYKYKINLNDILIVGSSILALYNLRKSADIDCIYNDNVNFIEDEDMSSHKSEKRFYPKEFCRLIAEHNNFFVINGIKYLSINNLLLFKLRRFEIFKDIVDIFLICVVKNSRKFLSYSYLYLVLIPFIKFKRLFMAKL